MNTINYRVSLDMFDTLSQTTIKAKKGDSACKIHITLTENGRIYKIGEGNYATFAAKKSDGTFIYDNCTIEGDTIVYDFSTSIDENGICQISACEGNVKCEVALWKNNGEQLTSPRFILFIDDTVYNGEEIISSPETNVLKTLVNEAKALVADIEEKLENGEFKGDKGDKGDTPAIDQTYNPESENAQSGKALEPIFDSKPTIFSGTDLNSEMPNGILSTMNTELITAKIGDLYVNIETQCLYGCIKEYDGHCTEWVALNKCTSDVYDSQSPMAMSGIAVGEAINNAIGDIDAALDAIIALQNSIIGGE